MKVILLQDIPNLGSMGAVVTVKDGYALNYLIPRKMAAKATERGLRNIEKMRAEMLKRLEKEKRRLEEVASLLQGVRVEIPARAGEGGRLFGAITPSHIASAIQNKLNLKVDRRKILLPEPLRILGSYEVKLDLGGGMSTQITVEVVEEKTEEAHA